MQKGNIWVVDDDSSIRWYLSEPLHEKADLTCKTFRTR